MKMKRFLTLICVVVLLVSACGKNGADTTAAAIDYSKLVYSPEYVTLPDGSYEVTGLCVLGENVYFIDQFRDQSSQLTSVPYTMKADGTGMVPLPDYDSGGLHPVALCENGEYLWVAETGTDSRLLRKLDANGAEISRIDVTSAVSASDMSNFTYINADINGEIYLVANGTLRVFNADGETLFTGRSDIDGTMMQPVRSAEGEVLIPVMGNVFEGAHISVKRLAPAKDALRIAGEIPNGMWFNANGDDNAAFYYGDSKAVYAYDGRNSVDMFYWFRQNISGDDFSGLAMLPDGVVLVAVKDNSGVVYDMEGVRDTNANPAALKFALLTPREAGTADVDTRTVLRLAVFASDENIRNLVLNFNRTNTEYRIEMTEYDTGLDMTTFDFNTEAIAQFNSALVSRTPPDIIYAAGMLSFDEYVNKGVFENLYPYLDSDTEVNRTAFVPELLRAVEKNGAVYQLPVDFIINSPVGLTSALGGRTSWTIDELLELSAQLPEGATALANTTSAKALQYLLAQNLASFIDWQSGECTFSSERFIRLLEYAGTYPAAITSAPYGETLIREGKALVTVGGLFSFYDHASNKLRFGENFTYIGLPCDEGNGSAFAVQHFAAISSLSAHKDVAWQAIRELFTLQSQTDSIVNSSSGIFACFPSNQAALELAALRACTPDMADDGTGNETEVPKTSIFIGGQPVDLYAITREDADSVLALIASIDKLTVTDYNLLAIINDEASAYFAGQRTAADAAQRIQNRVSLYVSERG